MRKNYLIVGLLLLLSFQSLSQNLDFQEKLNGIMLGQYRDCGWTLFGKPVQSDTYDDGMEYEIFLLRPDTSLYMIFEYAPGSKNIIWSIQIYGNDHDPDFKGLQLGMNEFDLNKIMGRSPDFSKDIGKYGKQIGYDSCNYSFEIDSNGILKSIKLTDESYKYFTGANKMDRIPSFSKLKSELGSGVNERISKLMAPDLELYQNDTVYYFQSSFEMEVNQDYSGIFQLINQNADELLKIQEGDSSSYEENLRLKLGANPMHVIKFSDSFAIKELVFKYQFDRYMLWEVTLRND